MRIKRGLIILLTLVLALGVTVFATSCNPPKEKSLSNIKAEDLSKIFVLRRSSSGKRAIEKDITDIDQMRQLLAVLNSVEYTKGEARMVDVTGDYRIILFDKDNKGKVVEILSESSIFMDKHYYSAESDIDLSKYDEFLD